MVDSRTEACDDGNETVFDGCEPSTCQFTCDETSPDGFCDDGNDCNGAGSCSPDTHRCEPGVPPAVGTPCEDDAGSPGVCNGEECVAPGCNNGVLEDGELCDDGNDDETDGCRPDCTFTCATDADCAAITATLCDGDETCDASHVCHSGTPLICDDGSACTVDGCDAALGCVAALIDADMDMHASVGLGSCGDDCDDANPSVYAGAPEPCDGIDNNCVDGTADEAAQVWYGDCDGDGYALAGATTLTSCNLPSATPCGGSGSWTARPPTGGDVDCDDTRADRAPYRTETVADGVDNNCDGQEICYVDADMDGRRLWRGPPCTGTICPIALPAPTTTTTDTACLTSQGHALASSLREDCCDSDARAYVGARPYYDAPRTGCGGYDYSCDGTTERRYVTAGSCGSGATCSGTTAGWTTGLPACGATGTYLTSCLPLGTGCLARTTTRTQTCR